MVKGILNTTARAGVALMIFLGARSASAEGLFDALAKSAGLATDVATPPDFVVKSRPAGDPGQLPVMSTPQEPTSHVKSEADLKAMDSDLEKSAHAHDALRSAFPPSAKAMAEAERKTKSKKKPAPKP